jgi:catechol 2,3-dioxygenase-like lactoylglutathione lyase family enzyme
MADTLLESELTDPSGRPILRPVFNHWGIATTRNDEMVEWYRIVVGMEVTLRSVDPIPKMTFVTNAVSHHTGGFFSPPFLQDDPDKREHTRIQHLAWEYESIDDLLETWDRLRGLGIEPVSTVCHGPSFAFYYRDPDNNVVELLADAYGDHVLSLRHMREVPEMRTNPQGSYIDPAKVAAARKDGAGLDELRERALAHEYDLEVKPHPLASF